ncbi:hypothetical protein QAD02_013600 [Eretmocerus hayati]|uniref:Uncharacterized protein n=1 Tax=Eretmocerus hayati TaxID=131215 RepID=A0ACC2P2W7_9HYME|nr:hypothetical protein QAD02_013600 [Eretmocerus hayati]
MQETADIHNRRILACGTVVRSKLLARSSEEEQKKVLEILLHSGKQRSYLSFEAILIQEKFRNVLTVKLIKKEFGYKEIIKQDSIADIVEIFTNIPRVACYKHPMYEVFCEKLIVTEFVEQFWVGLMSTSKRLLNQMSIWVWSCSI